MVSIISVALSLFLSKVLRSLAVHFLLVSCNFHFYALYRRINNPLRSFHHDFLGAQKCSKCHQPRKGHICPQANQFPPGMSSSASLSDFVGDPVDMNMDPAAVAEMLAAASGPPSNGPIVSPKLSRDRSKPNRNQNLAAPTDDDLVDAVDVHGNDLSSSASMLLTQNHQQSPSMHQQQQNQQHHQNLQTQQQPQHQAADLLTQSFLQNNAIDISMTGAGEEMSEEDIEEKDHVIDINGSGDMDGDDSAGLHDEVRGQESSGVLEDGGNYAIYSKYNKLFGSFRQIVIG